MSLDISKELKEYKVPDNMMDRFQNIMTFTKNMVLKDSKHYEEYEDSTTRWLGNLMIKYFDEELTNKEVIDLLLFVADYNEEVKKRVGDVPHNFTDGYNDGGYADPSSENNEEIKKLKEAYKSDIDTLKSEKDTITAEIKLKDEIISSPNTTDAEKKIARDEKTQLQAALDANNKAINDRENKYADDLYAIISKSDAYNLKDDNSIFRISAIYGLTGATKMVNLVALDNEKTDMECDGVTAVRKAFGDLKRVGSSDADNLYEKRFRNILSTVIVNCKSVSSFNSSLFYMIYLSLIESKFFKEILKDTSTGIDGVNNAEEYKDRLLENLFIYLFITGTLKLDNNMSDKLKGVLWGDDSNQNPLFPLFKDGESARYNLDLHRNAMPKKVYDDGTYENYLKYILRVTINDISKVENAFISRLYFLISNRSYDISSVLEESVPAIERQYDKRSASDTERSMAENGEPLIFIDIKLIAEEIDAESRDKINKLISSSEPIITTTSADIDARFDVSFQLLYKELNLAYRDTIEADMVDVAASIMWETIKLNLLGRKNSIPKAVSSSIRNITDNFFIKDICDDSGNVTGTTKLFEYRYTNPYMTRRGAESDLILYYSGDNYISNNYGLYSYQKREIGTFVEIYKETREYFYRVLLNEAFVNESEYSLYEKTFITFLAVMRFMDAKIDYIRDIELFTREDIESFLTTFGLGSLASILDVSVFLNSEAYSKALIRRYIDLMQNKGSREVISVLQEVFSLNTTELVIYKNIIIGEKKPNSDATENKEYKFIKVEYDTTNQLYTIVKSIGEATSLAVTTRNDPYWTSENTPDDLLEELGLNTSSTKYLIPEVSNEFSEAYINTRILFEIVDFIYRNANDKYDPTSAGGESISSEVSLENIKFTSNYYTGPLIGMTNSLKYLWFKYLKLINVEDIDYSFTSNNVPYSYNIANDIYRLEVPTKKGELEDDPKYGPDYRVLNKLRTFSDNGKTYYDLTDLYTIVKDSNPDNPNNITINESIISSILSGYDLSDSDIVKIKDMILSIAPILLYSKYRSFKFYKSESIKDDGSIDENSASHFGDYAGTTIQSALNGSSLVYNLISGSVYNLGLPSNITHMLTNLYYHIFMGNAVSEMVVDTLYDPDEDVTVVSGYTGDSSYSDYHDANYTINEFSTELCNFNDSEDLRAGIITVCSDLISTYNGIVINLNLSAKDDVMISFLKTAIEYFISYTTEILNFSYRNTYRSYLEASTVTDFARTEYKHYDIDSFYYDEELFIEIEERK